jgi:hypothetical protein
VKGSPPCHPKASTAIAPMANSETQNARHVPEFRNPRSALRNG